METPASGPQAQVSVVPCRRRCETRWRLRWGRRPASLQSRPPAAGSLLPGTCRRAGNQARAVAASLSRRPTVTTHDRGRYHERSSHEHLRPIGVAEVRPNLAGTPRDRRRQVRPLPLRAPRGMGHRDEHRYRAGMQSRGSTAIRLTQRLHGLRWRGDPHGTGRLAAAQPGDMHRAVGPRPSAPHRSMSSERRIAGCGRSPRPRTPLPAHPQDRRTPRGHGRRAHRHAVRARVRVGQDGIHCDDACPSSLLALPISRSSRKNASLPPGLPASSLRSFT